MTQKPISKPLQEHTPTAVANTTIGDKKHRALFDAIPVSLWEEDFSEVKQFLNQLCQQGICDFRAYFDEHPQDVAHCLKLVKVNAVNQASLQLFKASSQTELINNLATVLGPEPLNLFKEELILLGEGKTFFESERVNYTLNNEKLNVVVRWSVPPGFEETLAQVFVSILDFTSQKQAEEKLRLQATALQSAANAIVIANNNGDILWVNPAFTRLTGYTEEEVLGENPRILKSGKTSEAIYEDLWQTILAGKVWHCEELINRRKDGSLYTEKMTITPIKDEAGQIVRFIAIKEDISERQQIELQLRKQLQEEELLRQIVAINPGIDELHEALALICEKLATFYKVPSVSFTLLDKDAMLADIMDRQDITK